MAFRADEAASSGFERVLAYLAPREFSLPERAAASRAFREIIEECGPVITRYPTWHPLVRNHSNRQPEVYPSDKCGYKGLDHTVYLAHGFITCPYRDGADVFKSVAALPEHDRANITAEKIDTKFYNNGTTAILVRCHWADELEEGLLIPKRVAVPLMMEQELPCWTWAQYGETWETMRPYLLGSPHGSRSSLFVSQDTALSIKKMYLSMVETGMFGPMRGQ